MGIILGTNRYAGPPLELVREEVPEGFDYRMLESQTDACFLQSVADVEYILAGGRLNITAEVLDRAKRLKMIQRSGVGLDSLDLRAIRERGIPLYVNQGVNTQSVAEHTLLLILASLRRLTDVHRNTVNGIWKKQEQGVRTDELYGKTVGIIGMGNSGHRLACLLQPFHVNLLYNSRSRKPALEDELGMHYVTLEALLRQSDIVSLSCALNAHTVGLINRDTIETMKDGAILVNTARGGLVETGHLAHALQSGKLAYAGIDVYETEPIPEDYPLKKLNNVILTPHIAGITASSFRAMMHDAFRNIECFEQGRLREIEAFRYL